ncbi:MAG: Zn-dependent protease with chaperone function [Kiritimatiellia bacterium]|jgi:Zn-dependent protease with chaperone function
MDFFASQDAARKKSGMLVVYFFAAVVLIILTVYLLVAALSMYFAGPQFKLWNEGLFFGVSLIVSLVVFLGSLYKLSMIREGGAAVANMMGCRLVPTNSAEVLERRALNVVAEMALASGVPVPPVYLMDHEPSINAFAAGFNPEDAVIGISRGALDALTRDELQGVVAHEFSHLLNGDMRLNIRLIGVIHGILLLHLIGYGLMRVVGQGHSRHSRDSNQIQVPVMIFAVCLMGLGWIGVFFGRMIKSAVSRQREFLADASAVQFTRNPDGIGGALIKVGRCSSKSFIAHRRAEEVSHLFFGNALKRVSGLMATHPPLTDRIHRLLPHFDGSFPPLEGREIQANRVSVERAPAPGASMLSHTRPVANVSEIARDPDDLLQVVGAPLADHVAVIKRLLHRLPPAVLEAAHEPFGARALVYVLLLHREPALVERQMEGLRANADQLVFQETQRLLGFQEALPPEVRLPLVDLCLAALRALSPPQYEDFRKNVLALSNADQQISLFEYTLRHVLIRHLDAAFRKPRMKVIRYHSLARLKKECAVVLSMLARFGHKDEVIAQSAFASACSRLPTLADHLVLLPLEKCTLNHFDKALDQLAQLEFRYKKGLLVACMASIAFDQQLTVTEAELFRGIADALECPVPPWLQLQALKDV